MRKNSGHKFTRFPSLRSQYVGILARSEPQAFTNVSTCRVGQVTACRSAWRCRARWQRRHFALSAVTRHVSPNTGTPVCRGGVGVGERSGPQPGPQGRRSQEIGEIRSGAGSQPAPETLFRFLGAGLLRGHFVARTPCCPPSPTRRRTDRECSAAGSVGMHLH